MSKEELPEGWKYSPARKELYCPHGVGHPLPSSDKIVHGCCRDNCCNPDNNTGWTEAVETIKQILENKESDEE